ncbi:MAG: hypothetical protein ABL930_05295 [Pseudobdellovibrio sp.]
MNSKLEALFEVTPEIAARAEYNLTDNQKNFQILNNNQLIENLSYVFTEEITSSNIEHFFMQLSSYFEIGFLLKSQPEACDFKIQSAFVFAKKMSQTNELKAVSLPKTNLFQVLKTPAIPLLKKFNMQSLDKFEQMDAYLLPLTSNYSLVLITQIAEPWAELKISTLQSTLMKINFTL